MQYTKQRRTLTSALAGFTALSLLLSACGSDDDAPDTATTASQEGEDSSEPEENMSTPLDTDEDGDEDGADENARSEERRVGREGRSGRPPGPWRGQRQGGGAG